MVILIEKLLLQLKDLHLYDQAFITHCVHIISLNIQYCITIPNSQY